MSITPGGNPVFPPQCPECRNEMTRCAYGERCGEPYHCHVCNWPGR